MARWERALAVLRERVPEGERVLDLGCANGWGTAKVARHYETFGIDPSEEYIEQARRRVPSAHLTVGPAEHLPYPDGHFAAVQMLDVLEHVENERAAICEIVRVLRPGGLLVISVPHTGLMRWFDSNNVYAWLTGEDPLSPPGTPRSNFRYHRHYSFDALKCLLGDRFEIEYVHRSSLGISELLHLLIMLICKRLLRSKQLYRIVIYLYFGAFIVEDFLPFDKWGYHVMIAARRKAP